ncbi:14193_t:CDS:2 [Cetraspora pellucida]|uniref:14193_t:CDS:1 n=1 Tax=Cetraspora pellucida TaxID=1433469 RepID=A0A9N9E2K4_9GLOM|nr:14193_t:CDS:2 [Cetraspora pellucida]
MYSYPCGAKKFSVCSSLYVNYLNKQDLNKVSQENEDGTEYENKTKAENRPLHPIAVGKDLKAKKKLISK